MGPQYNGNLINSGQGSIPAKSLNFKMLIRANILYKIFHSINGQNKELYFSTVI